MEIVFTDANSNKLTLSNQYIIEKTTENDGRIFLRIVMTDNYIREIYFSTEQERDNALASILNGIENNSLLVVINCLSF